MQTNNNNEFKFGCIICQLYQNTSEMIRYISGSGHVLPSMPMQSLESGTSRTGDGRLHGRGLICQQQTLFQLHLLSSAAGFRNVNLLNLMNNIYHHLIEAKSLLSSTEHLISPNHSPVLSPEIIQLGLLGPDKSISHGVSHPPKQHHRSLQVYRGP